MMRITTVKLDSDEKLFEGVEIGLKRFIYENGKMERR